MRRTHPGQPVVRPVSNGRDPRVVAARLGLDLGRARARREAEQAQAERVQAERALRTERAARDRAIVQAWRARRKPAASPQPPDPPARQDVAPFEAWRMIDTRHVLIDDSTA
jgi:hypothetical protein